MLANMEVGITGLSFFHIPWWADGGLQASIHPIAVIWGPEPPQMRKEPGPFSSVLRK